MLNEKQEADSKHSILHNRLLGHSVPFTVITQLFFKLKSVTVWLVINTVSRYYSADNNNDVLYVTVLTS